MRRGRVCVLSLHPTRDVILDVPDLAPGGVNRARSWFSYPAGKALNVARTVGMLGGQSEAIVLAPAHWASLLAGFLGRYRVGFRHFPVEGEGRVCVMLDERSRETVVNTDLRLRMAPGTRTSLLAAVRRASRDADFTVCSGSLPPSMGSSSFRQLLGAASGGRSRLVLDLSGARLRSGIRHRPWLVKPNLREFRSLTGATASSLGGLLAAARELRARGVGRVLLSLGSRGCLLASPAGNLFAPAVSVRCRFPSPVGCGDALLGGFLRAAAAGRGDREALRLGVAAATANLAHPGACMMNAAEVRRIVPRVTVRELRG